MNYRSSISIVLIALFIVTSRPQCAVNNYDAGSGCQPCAPNEFSDGTSACAPCDGSCNGCTGGNTLCDACASTYFWVNDLSGTCTQNCAPN